MAASRRFLGAGLALVVLLTTVGTLAWIAAILRPAPVIAPAPIVAQRLERGVLVFAVAPARGDPIDAVGATVRAIGLAIATGRLPRAEHVRAIAIEARAPALRLVFDRGVLVAGTISNQTADHLLGLAGEGSRWPSPRAAYHYCGRIETSRGDFCAKVRGR